MTILLNGDIWSGTRMWNQSSTGGHSLELSGHSLNGGTWLVTGNLPSPGLGTQPEAEGHSPGEWRRLVCYQLFDLVLNYASYG